MNKTYKLLIESPEYLNGTEARWNDIDNRYDIYSPDGVLDETASYITQMQSWNVENRPNIWELQEYKLDLRSPEAEKMREESRATRFDFIPTVGSLVFCYDHAKSKPCRITYTQSFCNDWNAGFIKRTPNECKTHGEKYARYFLTE